MDKETKAQLARVKKKDVELKVYAMLIKPQSGVFLWLEAAYSLENAFHQAKTQLTKLHPHIDFSVSKIELFNHETVESLFSRSRDAVLSDKKPDVAKPKMPASALTPEQKVSVLMKQIIENKDWNLLEENRSNFTQAQVRFLEDKLKQK